MQNVVMTVAYDGTGYRGWQKTETGPSIEARLEAVLEQILQEKVTLQAASRTDAGVHALGQVVNFFTQKERVDFQKLRHSVNCLLPGEITVLEMQPAAIEFHPTLDTLSKEYHYLLCHDTVQLPQERLYSWHYPCQLDVKSMREAASQMIGTHDFAAFCNSKKNAAYAHHVREVDKIEIVELPGDRIRFEISGKNFLYKMVRNIVGTLVYVGCGKILLKQIPHILQQGDRTKAGVTAPAHGLTLYQVSYSDSTISNCE